MFTKINVMAPKHSSEYSPVDSDSEKAEGSPFLSPIDQDRGSRRTLKRRYKYGRAALTILPWVTTIFFAGTTAFGHHHRHWMPPMGTYEMGFATDMVLPSHDLKIPLETRRFTGASHFSENGAPWLSPVDKAAPFPENLELFGEPNPQIDENWEKLIGSRYFSISEEEATRAWGHKRHEYVDEELGGYTAGLDVFHVLHCVNALRKVIRNDYYQMDEHHLHGPEHTEHCLNLIRQSVQCSGSSNLIPSSFREGLQHNYVDSDQTHTCRSISFLREWTDSRQPGEPGYVQRDLSLVDERKHKLSVDFARSHGEDHVMVEALHTAESKHHHSR